MIRCDLCLQNVSFSNRTEFLHEVSPRLRTEFFQHVCHTCDNDIVRKKREIEQRQSEELVVEVNTWMINTRTENEKKC